MFDGVPSQGTLSSTALPVDVLESIFERLSPHERRAVLPLVCKSWVDALKQRATSSSLWTVVEVRDAISSSTSGDKQAGISALSSTKLQQLTLSVYKWLWDRRCAISTMVVSLTAAACDATSSTAPLASWCKAFGLAMPALASSTSLKHLTLRGPGVMRDSAGTPASALQQHQQSACIATEAAGTVLLGAFSLPSLEVLHVYDIPWAAALHLLAAPPSLPAKSPAPASRSDQVLGFVAGRLVHAASPPPCICGNALPNTTPGLLNLQEVTISRSFHSEGGAGCGECDLPDGAVAEAWGALGHVLGSLPHLERLDLSYTHAMTYCDPARGAVPAPWPALRRLQHLSLAHDLSVQPPPPPPGAAAGSSRDRSHDGVAGQGEAREAESGAAVTGELHGDAGAAAGTTMPEPHSAASLSSAGGAVAAALSGQTAGADPWFGGGAGIDAALAMLSEEGEYSDGDDVLHWPTDGGADPTWAADVDLAEAGEPLLEELAAFPGVGAPMLTVDAAHAAVELLTWLPTCTALTSLDLRSCGLEAVPLSVVHLPYLATLDLRGNPLVTLRLPGPLQALTWLGFSLDPCYDLVYDMRAAEVGEAAASEEMYVAELPAPRLEELQVTGSSTRALDLIRRAAAELPLLRRLALTHTGFL